MIGMLIAALLSTGGFSRDDAWVVVHDDRSSTMHGGKSTKADRDDEHEIASIQHELSKAQQTLGREQEKIGREQEKMGHEQERLSKEVQRKVEALIEASLKNGTAKPVD